MSVVWEPGALTTDPATIEVQTRSGLVWSTVAAGRSRPWLIEQADRAADEVGAKAVRYLSALGPHPYMPPEVRAHPSQRRRREDLTSG